MSCDEMRWDELFDRVLDSEGRLHSGVGRTVVSAGEASSLGRTVRVVNDDTTIPRISVRSTWSWSTGPRFCLFVSCFSPFRRLHECFCRDVEG